MTQIGRTAGGAVAVEDPGPPDPQPWHALPVVMLRQAGYPIDLLAGLADPEAVAEVAVLRAEQQRARQWAGRLKDAFRQAELPDRERAASWLGYLRPFGTTELAGLAARLPEPARAVLRAYQRSSARLTAGWREWEERHRLRLARAGDEVAAAFRADASLRDALLLSNDANYAVFEAWLAAPEPAAGKRARKMVDLLARYLQRFAAKNETHAHFGPISTGHLDADQIGLHWTDIGAGRRVGFVAHWAAEALAEAFAGLPGLREHVRPRRRPLAFVDGDRIRVYAPTTHTGLVADWRFEQVADERIGSAQALLLGRCDGVRTLAQLRQGWTGPDLDPLLAELARRDWLVVRFEIPVGEPAPLRALREALPPPTSSVDAGYAHDVISRLERGLDGFVAAGPEHRQDRLVALKETFTAAAGRPANRGAGRIYADRSIVFEECHSRAAGLTYGPDLAALLTCELAPCYDLSLAGARLRIRAEREILAAWLARRFGPGRPVPLGAFYAGYIADRAALDAECATVDAAVDGLDSRTMEALLGGADVAAREVEVSPTRLAEVVARAPAEPAVCNPDVLLAADSADALARGDFTVVLGEVHAVRELLCHSSMAPLVAESTPDLAAHVYAAYRGLLDDDEVLCDLVRSHPNKTGSQLRLPCPDLEITGRSGKPRVDVLSPDDLSVAVSGGRAELRARGVPGRLRLLTAPAGGPSIRQDPLAPFAFPRHFGGAAFAARKLPHVPRLRCGRVVLSRECWRMPTEWVRATGPGGGRSTGDAAEFAAVQGVRDRLALPRHVFVRAAGEPKPIYVDLDSPLLVRQMCRLVRAADGPVQLSEMLPAPDQLWLRFGGRRFTSELRYAVFSRPPHDRRT